MQDLHNSQLCLLGYLPIPRPIYAKHVILGSAPKHSQKKSRTKTRREKVVPGKRRPTKVPRKSSC